MQPFVLAPQLITRPYRGGSRLAAFRRISEPVGDRCGEDWLASTTTVFGEQFLGLTVLADGRVLREAIQSEPEAFLGAPHVEVFGASTGLLVKLIDAQQRLSVHAHPSRSFSRTMLSTPYGKNEAWYVLSTDADDAAVHLGFDEDIDSDELLDIVESGRGSSLIDRMNRIEVSAGDAVFVPAGTPHAIGSGITLAEVQEPSDLLVRLEWSGYSVGSMPGDLGLGLPVALGLVDRTRWSEQRLASSRCAASAGAVDGSLLPAAADPFFRLDHVTCAYGPEVLSAGFGVLVVLEGSGRLDFADGSLADGAGGAVLIPHSSGDVDLSGSLTAIRARPAEPTAAREADPSLPALLRQSLSS